jgi:hypothetical protein
MTRVDSPELSARSLGLQPVMAKVSVAADVGSGWLVTMVFGARSTSRHVVDCDQLVSRRNSAVFLCW